MEERELLFALPSRFSAKAVLEIGSFVGGSTSALAQGMTAGEIFCIDPFCFYRSVDDQPYQLQRWLENTRNWQDEKPGLRVTPLVGSVTSPPIRYFLEDRILSFDAAFVDGAHDASSTIVDLACILPSMKTGSAIAMHDHLSKYGVPFACSLFEETGFISKDYQAGSIQVYQRTKKPWDDKLGVSVRGYFG